MTEVMPKKTKYPCKCGHYHITASWNDVPDMPIITNGCDRCDCNIYRPDIEVTDELLRQVITRICNAIQDEEAPK